MESTTEVARRPKSDMGPMMSAEQSRAARAWLGWSQDDLANRGNVSVNTVRNFEGGQKVVHPNSIGSMRQAIEAAGIKFLFDGRGEAAGIIRQSVPIHELRGNGRKTGKP